MLQLSIPYIQPSKCKKYHAWGPVSIGIFSFCFDSFWFQKLTNQHDFTFFFQTEQDSRYKFTSPDWVNGCVILDSWFHVLSLCTLSFRSKFYAYTIWSQIFIFLTEASILTFVFFCRVNFVTKGSLNKARMIWTSIILYYADVFQFIYDLMSEKFFYTEHVTL